jgi:hypothetical protein
VWPIGLKLSLPMELNIHFVAWRYGSTNDHETHIILRSFPISVAASGIESIHYLLEKEQMPFFHNILVARLNPDSAMPQLN